MSGYVDVPRGLVAARGAVVFVSDAMAMDGTKYALDQFLLDGGLGMCDVVVEGVLLGGVEVGASAAGAAGAVVPYSSQGKV